MKVKKYKICKHYECDIWGEVVSKGKINKSFFFFKNLLLKQRRKKESIFHIGPLIISRRRRKKIYGRILFMRQRLFAFYGGFKQKYYRKILKQLSHKVFVNISNEFLTNVEMRLDVLFYRSNFCVNIFESKDLIKKGFLLVNKKRVKDPRYQVKVGDVIEVVDWVKPEIYGSVLNRLKKRQFLYNCPKHIEVSNSLIVFIVVSKPYCIDYIFKLNKEFLSLNYIAKF